MRRILLLLALLALPTAVVAQTATQTDTAGVVIYTNVVAVQVVPGMWTAHVGDTITFHVKVTDEVGDTAYAAARWVSLDPSRVSIDSITGKARALHNGRLDKAITFRAGSLNLTNYMRIALYDRQTGELAFGSVDWADRSLDRMPDGSPRTAMCVYRWQDGKLRSRTLPCPWLDADGAPI